MFCSDLSFDLGALVAHRIVELTWLITARIALSATSRMVSSGCASWNR